jgi:hypothetical protein
MEPEILKRKPYSNHPDDHYLEIVLAKVELTYHPFVVWLYNKNDSGYNNGSYFETFEEAEKDFGKKGVTKPKRYNHAYAVAFSVESNDPEHCTFEEWIDALHKRVSNLEEMETAHASEFPYDTYEN